MSTPPKSISDRLLALATEMVRGQGMPDLDWYNWPKRTPQHILNKVDRAEKAAHEQCREWGIALRSLASELYAASCIWLDDNQGNYDTACGQRFALIDGSPGANGMKFCCYCGLRIGDAAETPEGES